MTSALQLSRKLCECGRSAEAARILIAAIDPSTAAAAHASAAGVLLDFADRHTPASRYHERAASIEPGNPEYQFNLAASLRMVGRLDAARAAVKTCLRLVPAHARALSLLAALRQATPVDNSIGQLALVMRNASLEYGERVAAIYSLAKELDDIGEHAGAFECLRQAAALQRPAANYDVESDLQMMRAVADAPMRPPPSPQAKCPSDLRPIFVAGLPRSGTSLVEQLIRQSDSVDSVGESPDLHATVMQCLVPHLRRGAAGWRNAVHHVDPDHVARQYLAAARRRLDGDCLFVDKCCTNFLYFGFVAASLPEAKMLLLRRYALDTCLGILSTNFSGLYPYAFDWGALAKYVAAFERLAQHWAATISKDRLLVVEYERLVASPVEETQRIYEFLGLPWSSSVVDLGSSRHPSSTASAVQVRQSIFSSSVGKWRRHARDLEPLAEALAAERRLQD